MRCLELPLFLTLVSLTAAPTTAQSLPDPLLQERVRATFDSNGEFDHAGLPKGGGVVDDESAADLTPLPLALGIGGPANSDCGTATVIPGNTVTYNPPVYSTAAAGTELCGAQSSCAGASGTSASVWYSYTPGQDGRVTIHTLGSSYNTVLSVYDGCGFFSPFGGCIDPIELACNNDYFFGTTSQVTLDVDGGETYIVKVAQFGTLGTGGLLDFNLSYAPANDACADAELIVGLAFDPPLLSTHNAITDVCEAEEDCEFNAVGVSNSVWYSFIAPCDGLIDANTNGTSYDTVLSVWDGCAEFVGVDANCVLPAQLACDDDSGTGLNSQLIGIPVEAGNEYLIKLSDYSTSQGGGWLDFHFLFRTANPPVAEIATPLNFGSVCDQQLVTGTASAGENPLAEWALEYQPTSGSTWTPIASSSSPVLDGTLGSWTTIGLTEGYYFLRLTVTNACGFTNSDTAVVYVDKSFSTLTVDVPQNGDVVAGTTCFDGTVWDPYLASYTVEYRPQGGGSFLPVGPGTFSQTVVNTAIVPGGWNTTAVPDGDYELRIQALDECGNAASETIAITIDNTLPTAKIFSPADCSYQYGSIEVIGVIDDANLASWSLQHSQEGEWRTIATGNSQVLSATIATWDLGALPHCSYALRLIVTSEAIVNCTSNQWSEYVIGVSNDAPPGGLQGLRHF